jgi:Subtilase family
MKAFWLKSSLISMMLLLVAAVGALPTRSDDGQKLRSFNERQPQKKHGARTSTPLSYRSPGARHKLVIANQDIELQQQLQAAGVIRKARHFNAYSIVEVSSETLDQLAPQALERARLRDDLNLVLIKRGQIDTSGPAPVVADDLRQAAGAARSLHLIQLFGPPTPEAHAAIKATGARIVIYVPNNAYLVWGTTAQINRLAALRQRGDVVQWDGPYHPAYKLDPRIKPDSVEQIGAAITVLDTPEAAATIARIKSVARGVLMPEYKANGSMHVTVLTESLNLKQLAQLPNVIGVEPWSNPHMMDERANQIVAGQLTNDSANNVPFTRPTAPGYLAFLNSLGFTSDFDFAIDFADSGFDVGSNDPAKMHTDFTNAAGQARIAYLLDYTGDLHDGATHDVVGHGTINTSIAAGFNDQAGDAFQDAGGYAYGLGVAPFARIGISKIFNDDGAGDFGRFSYTDLVSSAYRSGARISSNSWGQVCSSNFDCNIYDDQCAVYDGLVRDADPLQEGNQGMVVVFSAGNDGESGEPSISIPATAKNIICVGASENYRPSDPSGRPSADRCGDRAVDGDNSQDVIGFSSFGLVQDGRAKPDLVAPGTFVVGAATQDTTFSGDGVCAVPGSFYYPVGQKRYTLSSGTSHSAPMVSGAAALAFQWLRGQLSHDPSPAMVKAMILNSTRYLTGRFSNDDLPGAHQGWGLLDIGRMLEPTNRIFYDESPDRTFTESGGQPFEISGVISDPTKEFRVMLAYTDAPGAAFSSTPIVNQLALEVIVGGAVVYQGNNFKGQYSQADGQSDFRNNTQGVRLPVGTTGPFTIRIKPTVIAGDGVSNFGGPLDQDFALVVSNGVEIPLPLLAVDNSSDVSAGVSVKHANDTTDASLIPGEQAAITVTVANKSASAAAEVSNASLSLTVNGQTIVGGVAGGAVATIPPGSNTSTLGPFNLQIPAALRCGAVAQGQLTIETSVSTFKLPVRIQAGRATGAAMALIDDDVDSARLNWKKKKGFEIVNNVAHSGTMSYHVADPGKEDNDVRLGLLFTKKSFAIPANVGGVRLSFYHIFNFEPGYDGGVLEISTDNGETWIDLGTRMLVGGYDGKVTAASNNPLGSRAAWTLRGVPGVFSQVIVNLDDFVGKRVRLRFEAGFDEATGILDGYEGWFIDDIRLTAIPFACGAVTTAEQPAETASRRIWLGRPGSRSNAARVE